MFEILMIYLLVQAESIARAFTAISITGLVFAIILLLWMFVVILFRTDQHNITIREAMLDDSWFADCMKWVKRGGIAWVVGLILATATPSQQNMAIIVGSTLVYKAATSETGQRITNKGVELLEQKIDQILSQMPTDKEKPTDSTST